MMHELKIKDTRACKYDCLSLGEVMLRFDPGESRIHTSRYFRVWEGGGEYNVTRGLRRCFGMKTAIVTAMVDNSVGRLIEDCILQGGVCTDHILWRSDDGIGLKVRNGLNFTERGFGIRGAIGVSDRGNSAASQLKPGDIDWEYIFGDLGVRWFHTGGIFAALSDSTQAIVLEAVACAKKHGTIVSYDLNYRPSLWKERGGKEAAIKVNRSIVGYVDVLIGNEEDFEASLGFPIQGVNTEFSSLDKENYATMVYEVLKAYPRLYCIATTLRVVKTATINDWDAIMCVDGKLFQAIPFKDLEILDRVGGGDSFVAGLVYGFLNGFEPGKTLAYALTNGALAMSTPGDTSMALQSEIERIVTGKSARVIR
ncbi:MAG: PfkB family carbohydrate kinase [Sphaerochaetaceae bacterium]